MRVSRARASGWSTTVSSTRDTVAGRGLRNRGRTSFFVRKRAGSGLDGASSIRHSMPVTNTAALPARPYESPLRRAQAESTRAAVLDGAAALFVRDGYLRTTMKAIAAEAGTS